MSNDRFIPEWANFKRIKTLAAELANSDYNPIKEKAKALVIELTDEEKTCRSTVIALTDIIYGRADSDKCSDWWTANNLRNVVSAYYFGIEMAQRRCYGM